MEQISENVLLTHHLLSVNLLQICVMTVNRITLNGTPVDRIPPLLSLIIPLQT